MVEAFANDPIALRQLIAYEALGNIPPFDGYKNLCKRIGDGLMEYIDYEFWYMRFARGEMDMEFDGSRDPTLRSIHDLPMEILKPIFETLKPIERLMMHKVSPRLRTCIESMDPKLRRLSFKSGKEHSEINYDFTDVIYRQGKEGGCQVKSNQRKEVSVPNSNHFELALHDISVVFNNPKLHLESLYICVDADKMQRLREILERLDFKIKTDKVEFHTENSTEEAAILPCLQSGTLENICIHMREYKSTTDETSLEEKKGRISKLTEMIECKESKMLILHLDFKEDFPIEQLLNCRGLSLHSTTWRWFVPASTVIKFLEILLKSTVLETFIIDNYDRFKLKEAIRNNGKPLWNAVETHNGIFKLEGFEQVFKLDISIARIRLTRQ
ncbi:hypothetical protein CRE_07994 [Caenorhabditis remanei]|uniref:F-box domain-containing protein n=1 Tax=Caenorhabditis remanei TaxID=31234 RepID=E3M3P6_CAERE|nr:hypothetical protein CRE_07994 [Caenorhabditis remanei]